MGFSGTITVGAAGGFGITAVSSPVANPGPGDTIIVDGFGFDADGDGLGDEYCPVLVGPQGNLIGLVPVVVTPAQIVFEVGDHPASAAGQPHQLAIVEGNGGRFVVPLENAGVVVTEPGLRWDGDPMQAFVFQGGPILPALPTTPLATDFYSDPFSSGGTALTLTIDEDWGPCTRFRVQTRIHPEGRPGSDTNFQVLFAAQGDRFDCARAICDFLEKVFDEPPPYGADSARPSLGIDCTITDVNGDAVLTIALEDGGAMNAA